MLVELSLGGAITLGESLGGVLRLGGLLEGVLTLRVGGLTLPGLPLFEKLFFLCLVVCVTLGGDGDLDSGDGAGDLALPAPFLFG